MNISIDYTWLMAFGIKCARALFITFIGWAGAKYVARKMRGYLSKVYSDAMIIDLLARVGSYVILFATLAAVLYEFGMNPMALIGAAGVLGVAVGFAAKTSIANVISGLFLLVERPFELGDKIDAAGAQGTVQAINLFAVILKTTDGKMVRVPHEKLLKSVIVNETQK